MCDVILATDSLLGQRTMRRNPAYAEALRRIRRHAERANAAICLSCFGTDTLSDLDLKRETAGAAIADRL